MSTRTSATAPVLTGAEKTKREDLEEQVRCRAYEIYERRGGADGHDLEDWLQAESELLRTGLKLRLAAPGVWVGPA